MGDIDLDGHMDFVVNAQKIDPSTSESYSLFFVNTNCPNDLLEQLKKVEYVASNCRFFQTKPPEGVTFTKVSGPASFVSAFFDWGEMG